MAKIPAKYKPQEEDWGKSKGKEIWLGKLLEHPEIMTQGETLEELEENIKDAYRLMAMDR